MSNNLTKKLQALEKVAQKTTATQVFSDQLATVKQTLASIGQSPVTEQIRQALSFVNRYPALSQLGQIQLAIDNGAFRKWREVELNFQRMCEPFLSARQMIEAQQISISALMETPFADLVQANRYTLENHVVSNLSQVGAISEFAKSQKLATSALATVSPAMMEMTTLRQSLIDTSWMYQDVSWMVETSKLVSINTEGITKSALTELLAMEQQTCKLLADLGGSNLTSITAQIASIEEAYSKIPNLWKETIAPSSIISDLSSLAVRQHEEMQKAGSVSKWRLGLLDAASRFVDRQVTWANSLFAGLQDEIKDDGDTDVEDIACSSVRSPVALIPQHIGYTNRLNVDRSPEEGLEKSSIVEITEKGKRIIENAVAINKLCDTLGHNPIFKYTSKFVLYTSRISGTLCSSEDTLGIIIDGFYMVFYENLQHIKKLVTEKAVKEEAVYQCIFRMKSIRTDLRHDYEHGSEKNINKKKEDIVECYRHYTNKPVLREQGDYILLQKRMYDEFIELEEHLINILYETTDVR